MRQPGRSGRVLRKVAYWLAVLVISVAILVALILFLESRDESSVNGGLAPTSARPI
jgi:hypothetical protein